MLCIHYNIAYGNVGISAQTSTSLIFTPMNFKIFYHHATNHILLQNILRPYFIGYAIMWTHACAADVQGVIYHKIASSSLELCRLLSLHHFHFFASLLQIVPHFWSTTKVLQCNYYYIEWITIKVLSKLSLTHKDYQHLMEMMHQI